MSPAPKSSQQNTTALGVIALVALLGVAAAPVVVAWLAGTDGRIDPGEAAVAFTVLGGFATAFWFVVRGAVRDGFRALIAPELEDLACDTAHAWDANPHDLDARVLGVMEREAVKWRAASDRIYADVLTERRRTDAAVAEMRGTLKQFDGLPKAMEVLGERMAEVAGQIGRAVEGLARVERSHQDQESQLRKTREEFVEMRGEWRRDRDDDRRRGDSPPLRGGQRGDDPV